MEKKEKQQNRHNSHHVLATKIKGLRKSDNKIHKHKTKTTTIVYCFFFCPSKVFMWGTTHNNNNNNIQVNMVPTKGKQRWMSINILWTWLNAFLWMVKFSFS